MDSPLTVSNSYQATVSSQGQITIPVELRRLLGLKPGSSISLLAKRVHKNIVTLVGYAQPDDPIEKYAGIGEEFYKKLGGADKVIAEERNNG